MIEMANQGAVQGGTDFVCSLGGDDRVAIYGFGTKADTGSGSDNVIAYSGAWADAGSGNDGVYAYDDDGAILLGGSGSDRLGDLGHANVSIDCGPNVDTYDADGPSTTTRRCESTADINP